MESHVILAFCDVVLRSGVELWFSIAVSAEDFDFRICCLPSVIEHVAS